MAMQALRWCLLALFSVQLCEAAAKSDSNCQDSAACSAQVSEEAPAGAALLQKASVVPAKSSNIVEDRAGKELSHIKKVFAESQKVNGKVVKTRAANSPEKSASERAEISGNGEAKGPAKRAKVSERLLPKARAGEEVKAKKSKATKKKVADGISTDAEAEFGEEDNAQIEVRQKTMPKFDGGEAHRSVDSLGQNDLGKKVLRTSKAKGEDTFDVDDHNVEEGELNEEDAVATEAPEQAEEKEDDTAPASPAAVATERMSQTVGALGAKTSKSTDIHEQVVDRVEKDEVGTKSLIKNAKMANALKHGAGPVHKSAVAAELLSKKDAKVTQKATKKIKKNTKKDVQVTQKTTRKSHTKPSAGLLTKKQAHAIKKNTKKSHIKPSKFEIDDSVGPLGQQRNELQIEGIKDAHVKELAIERGRQDYEAGSTKKMAAKLATSPKKHKKDKGLDNEVSASSSPCRRKEGCDPDNGNNNDDGSQGV